MTDDTEADVKKFVKRHGTTFPTIVDPGDISDKYKLIGHPMVFFIGADGELLDSRIGGTTEESLEKDFKRLFGV